MSSEHQGRRAEYLLQGQPLISAPPGSRLCSWIRIKEDRLGVDTIFIQAKRWQRPVGGPEIQKFVGALQGQRARKGVFITTSTYTADAVHYAAQIDTKVVLIDGQTLADLMIDFDVAVAAAASYTVKRIDSDYFDEA